MRYIKIDPVRQAVGDVSKEELEDFVAQCFPFVAPVMQWINQGAELHAPGVVFKRRWTT